MKKEKLLSVIVPTYNSELYLKQALNSILDQTYKNIELIIVDDNSQDDTKNIILEYAKNDNRVKYYFFDSNKGPGYARNFGVSKASGVYITLVDHDDFQELNRYELMINKIEQDNTDACASYSCDYIQETQKIRKHRFTLEGGIYDLSCDETYKRLKYSFIPPWSKIIKRELVSKYHMSFAEKDVKYDDLMFHSLFATQVKSISVLDKVLYYHRYFSKSISYNYADHLTITKDLITSFKHVSKMADNGLLNKDKVLDYYLPLFEKNYRRLHKKDLAPIKQQIFSFFIENNKQSRIKYLIVKRFARQTWNLIKKDRRLKSNP